MRSKIIVFVALVLFTNSNCKKIQVDMLDITPKKDDHYTIYGRVTYPDMTTGISDIRVSLTGGITDNTTSNYTLTDDLGNYVLTGIITKIDMLTIKTYNTKSDYFRNSVREIQVGEVPIKYDIILGREYLSPKKMIRDQWVSLFYFDLNELHLGSDLSIVQSLSFVANLNYIGKQSNLYKIPNQFIWNSASTGGLTTSYLEQNVTPASSLIGSSGTYSISIEDFINMENGIAITYAGVSNIVENTTNSMQNLIKVNYKYNK